MLMFDRITKITDSNGKFGKVKLLLNWITFGPLVFDCHFEMDPVMPGCLAWTQCGN